MIRTPCDSDLVRHSLLSTSNVSKRRAMHTSRPLYDSESIRTRRDIGVTEVESCADDLNFIQDLFEISPPQIFFKFLQHPFPKVSLKFQHKKWHTCNWHDLFDLLDSCNFPAGHTLDSDILLIPNRLQIDSCGGVFSLNIIPSPNHMTRLPWL